MYVPQLVISMFVVNMHVPVHWKHAVRAMFWPITVGWIPFTHPTPCAPQRLMPGGASGMRFVEYPEKRNHWLLFNAIVPVWSHVVGDVAVFDTDRDGETAASRTMLL
jgi:hypothetical protein